MDANFESAVNQAQQVDTRQYQDSLKTVESLSEQLAVSNNMIAELLKDLERLKKLEQSILSTQHPKDWCRNAVDGLKNSTKNMSFEIDKNIPMPEKTKSRTKYPFSRMVVGDSFLSDKKNMAPHLSYWTKKTGFTFTQRDDGGKARVWRVK